MLRHFEDRSDSCAVDFLVRGMGCSNEVLSSFQVLLGGLRYHLVSALVPWTPVSSQLGCRPMYSGGESRLLTLDRWKRLVYLSRGLHSLRGPIWNDSISVERLNSFILYTLARLCHASAWNDVPYRVSIPLGDGYRTSQDVCSSLEAVFAGFDIHILLTR